MLALFGAQAWAAPFAYISNFASNNVSLVDTATNAVVGAPIAVGNGPFGIAVNPAGTRVYVANSGSNTVSVIDTATNTVVGAPIVVGTNPRAFGQFIGPAASAPATIPTFNAWEMLLLALLLGAMGAARMRSRRS